MRTVIRCPIKGCAFSYLSDSQCPVHGDDDQADSIAAAAEALGIHLDRTPPGNPERGMIPARQ